MRRSFVRSGLLAAAFVLVASVAPAQAASRGSRQQSANTLGFGVGAFLPQSPERDLYDTGWEATIRGLSFGSSVMGGRAAVFYGSAKGKNGAGNGDSYGVDLDLAIRFGRKASAFYFFVGPGYYWNHFDRATPSAPAGPYVRFSDAAISANAGFGFSFKAFFVEASYVNVFTSEDDVRFIPVTIGFQF